MWECRHHVVDSAIVVDLVIVAAVVEDAVEMIVADLEAVVDAADEEATMILLGFADVVDEVVLTVDVVVADVAVAVIAVDLEIGTVIEAVVEAAVWIVADAVALIAVAEGDPIVVATVDVVDSIMIVADSAIVVVDLDEADMDHVMMDMDSRPDMGATIIKMIEQTNNLMILIINMMILNHVVMASRCHMTRDRMVKNLMVTTDINLADTDKIRNGYKFYFKGIVVNLTFRIKIYGYNRTRADTDRIRDMDRVAMDKADMEMALERHHRHQHLNGQNGKFDKLKIWKFDQK